MNPILAYRALSRLQGKKPHALALPGQPLDTLLLKKSPLFLKSRELFQEAGGVHQASFVSTPRTLGSSALLGKEVEYSALARELDWLSQPSMDKKAALERFLELRTSVTSLHHEQNHRVLWKVLPPCPSGREARRRWLNFSESLVVMLDMALGDELGPKLAPALYQVGVVYDPGTLWRKEARSPRLYRNLLHAACQATYWALEGYPEAEIRQSLPRLFAIPLKWAERAAERALKLDRHFIEKTNPLWQAKNGKVVTHKLGEKRGGMPALVLSEDPTQTHVHYLWAERVLDHWGIPG